MRRFRVYSNEETSNIERMRTCLVEVEKRVSYSMQLKCITLDLFDFKQVASRSLRGDDNIERRQGSKNKGMGDRALVLGGSGDLDQKRQHLEGRTSE